MKKASVKNQSKLKLNALGIFLLLLVPVVGPFPGPGGIPLLRASLGILAIHNPWAKKIETYIDHRVERLSDLFFWEDKRCQWAWDIFIVSGVATATYVTATTEIHWLWQLAISAPSGMLVIFFFYNRNRWQRLLKYLKINTSRRRPKAVRHAEHESARNKEETSLKALTLHQPWASLVATGHKKIETRSWRPPQKLVGGRIAIHAAIKLRTDLDENLAGAVAACLGSDWRRNLPAGAVIATAEIKEIKRIRNQRDIPAGTEALFGDYTPGRWAWHLDKVQTLAKPVPARGYQRLWQWKQNGQARAGNR